MRFITTKACSRPRNLCRKLGFQPFRPVLSTPIHKFKYMKTLYKFLAISALTALATSALAADAAVETLPSGVKIVQTTLGTGANPKATDAVKVHYRGTLADGKEFDSSYKRNAPATFPLNRVIPCWTQGMQTIKVGGKATLTCPPATAYGDRAPVPPCHRTPR